MIEIVEAKKERSLKMRDNENKSKTGALRKSNRSSIFDYHVDEIIDLRKLNLSMASIFKIIKHKLPESGATYNGFYRYCKRKEL